MGRGTHRHTSAAAVVVFTVVDFWLNGATDDGLLFEEKLATVPAIPGMWQWAAKNLARWQWERKRFAGTKEGGHFIQLEFSATDPDVKSCPPFAVLVIPLVDGGLHGPKP